MFLIEVESASKEEDVFLETVLDLELFIKAGILFYKQKGLKEERKGVNGRKDNKVVKGNKNVVNNIIEENFN